MGPSKKQLVAPVCVTRDAWLNQRKKNRWPWADDALPWEFFCGSTGTGAEICEIPLVRRLLVPPKKASEKPEQFLARVNKVLKEPYDLRPLRKESFGEDGFRLIAIEKITQHGVIVEITAWFRREGKCEWMRFPVEAQIMGSSHHPMVLLPLIQGPDQEWYLGLVKENRAALLWEGEFTHALEGVKNGWALSPPQGFAAMNAAEQDIELDDVEVRGLREEPPASLRDDSRSLFLRKLGTLTHPEEGAPPFQLEKLIWTDSFFYNPGQANYSIQVVVALLSHAGQPSEFAANLARRYGPRYAKIQFHPLAPLLGEDRVEVCRSLGIITAVNRASLFGITPGLLNKLKNI